MMTALPLTRHCPVAAVLQSGVGPLQSAAPLGGATSRTLGSHRLRQPAQRADRRSAVFQNAIATPIASSVAYLSPPAMEDAVTAQQKSYRDFDHMLLTSELPIIVDFHAKWCGPCVMMSNVLGVVSKKLQGAVTCVKIDADKYPSLAARYGVQALPTCILFKDGKVLDKVEGFMPAAPLQDRVNFRLNRPLGPGRRYLGP